MNIGERNELAVAKAGLDGMPGIFPNSPEDKIILTDEVPNQLKSFFRSVTYAVYTEQLDMFFAFEGTDINMTPSYGWGEHPFSHFSSPDQIDVLLDAPGVNDMFQSLSKPHIYVVPCNFYRRKFPNKHLPDSEKTYSYFELVWVDSYKQYFGHAA